MDWFGIPAAMAMIFLSTFGTTFLSSAWERRRKRNDALESIKDLLPGHDCGLCGCDGCRNYARFLLESGGDPGLCGPGGASVEERLRASLSDLRKEKKIAFVQCGGAKGKIKERYRYDGRMDCSAATALFEGPRECVDACLGFGSCEQVCPLGAITMHGGLARVNQRLCSGCGICVVACPKKVIRLVPDGSRWQVACNSRKKSQDKREFCDVSCTACGECVRLSTSWEFSISDNLARVSENEKTRGQNEGTMPAIAERCPTGAIVRLGEPGKASGRPVESGKKT